jgi:two-component sensor histidine kinase
LRCEADYRVLIVSDEGVGLGAGFDLDAVSEESLGMNLIRALTQQLGGTLRVDSEGGARFSIRF